MVDNMDNNKPKIKIFATGNANYDSNINSSERDINIFLEKVDVVSIIQCMGANNLLVTTILYK